MRGRLGLCGSQTCCVAYLGSLNPRPFRGHCGEDLGNWRKTGPVAARSAKSSPGRTTRSLMEQAVRTLEPRQPSDLVQSMEPSMRLRCSRSLVTSVCVAITWLTASLAEAQPLPPVRSSAPGVSVSPLAPSAPQANAGRGEAEPPASGNPADLTAPPAEARQETLADCMSFWDAGTHMSKTEWRETCKRTLNGRLF